MRSRQPSPTRLEDKPNSRCRKWLLRVPIGKDENGKYRYRSRTFHGGYRQAQEEMAQFVKEVSDGQTSSSDGRLTVRSYFEQYHRAREDSGNFTKRSMRTERLVMNNFLDILGDKRMCDVTASEVESAYARMRNKGGRSGSPLSQSTIALTHRYVVGMFRHAKERGDIPQDALRGLRAPKVKRREKKALSDDKARELASKLRVMDPLHGCALLCLECGLRRSEALALDWDHVHDRCVDIVASMDDDGQVGPPKSDAAFRKVPVPEDAWTHLMLWRYEQEDFCECDLVCSYDGSPITPPYMSTWWAREKKRLGVDCTLHELRHTYVSRLVRAGANPKVVQSLVGHSTIDVTMQVYSHVNEDDLWDAVCNLR